MVSFRRQLFVDDSSLVGRHDSVDRCVEIVNVCECDECAVACYVCLRSSRDKGRDGGATWNERMRKKPHQLQRKVTCNDNTTVSIVSPNPIGGLWSLIITGGRGALVTTPRSGAAP